MPITSLVPIEDWVRRKDIGGAIREIINITDRKRLTRSNVYQKSFPIKFIEDTSYEALRADYKTPMASLVGLDQKAPPVRGGKIQEFRTDFTKFVSRRVFTEAEQQKLYKATNEYGINLGITTFKRELWGGGSSPAEKDAEGNVTAPGYVNPGATIADFFFSVGIRDRRNAVWDTMDFLTAQLIQFGEATYIDPATNYRVDYDWRDPAATYNNFEGTLTQTGNTADKSLNSWNDTANADGLKFLRDEHIKYHRRNGFKAKWTVCRLETYYKLLDLQSTKDALRPYISPGGNINLVPAMEFNKYIANYDIPPFYVVEDTYDYITATGTIEQAYFFNEGRISFLNDNMGARYWGVVMNSKEGLQGPPKPGIYSNIIKPSEEEASRVAFAEGQGAPVVYDPKLLQSRQVYVPQ